jgi:hypothetical protein
MMNWNDYTTIHKWCDAKRKEGHKVSHKWFYEQVATGVLASVQINGVTYVRSQNLDDIWTRYRAEVKQNLSERGRESVRRFGGRSEEILERVKNIEAMLAIMAKKQ